MADEKRPRAVVDGRLMYTSASALNRFAFGCQRSWWFRYGPMHLPDPVGKAAELGNQIHKRIENYLKLGIDVLGRHERAALDAGLIPKPGSSGRYANKHPNHTDDAPLPPLMLDILAEGKVDGALDAGGTPIIGGMDLLDPRGDVPMIVDWKTKGDISEVAAVIHDMGPPYCVPTMQPDHDELVAGLLDPGTEYGLQMVAYAEWFRRAHPTATHVALRHVYIQTKKALVGETTTPPVPLATVARLWQSGVVDAHLGPMREAAKASRPEDVKANRDHCFKYHKPCPFMEFCPAGKPASFADLFNLEDNNVGLLDQFKKATSEPTPAQAAAVTPAPNVEVSPTPVAPATPPARTWDIGAAYRLANGEAGTLDSVNGLIGRFRVGKATEAKWVDVALATVGELVPVVAEEIAAPAASEPAPVQAPSDAPKKRGRPKKTLTEAALDSPAAGQQAPEAPPLMYTGPEILTVSESTIDALKAMKAASAYDGHARLILPPGCELRLYFGCAPLGVPTQTLHSYVDMLEQQILRTLDEQACKDVRLSSHDMLSFGKWKAVIGQTAIKSPPPPGHYVVSGMSGEKIQAVADALLSIAPPGTAVLR